MNWNFQTSGSVFIGLVLLTVGCGRRLDPRAEIALPKSSGYSETRFDSRSSGYTNAWLEWARELCVGGYTNAGVRNPRWDVPAINALEEHAYVRVIGHSRDPAASDYQETQLQAAIKAGCTDPLIRYLYMRGFSHPPRQATPQVAAQYSELAKQFEASGYAPLLKFYANMRAAEAWRAASRKQLPEVNEFRRAAMTQLQSLLRSEDMPASVAYQACQELYEVIARNSKQRTDFYTAVEPILLARWGREGFSHLIKARFYVDYAWEARGSGWAKDVTEDQGKLFLDRLSLAQAALDRAAKIDPKLAEVPLVGLRLQFGPEKNQEQMELWYQRAIKFPQNRYEAVRQKLRYLHPQWYGSEAEALAFAREVVKSDAFFGQESLQLYHTHEALADYFGKSRPNYWLEPQVWPDLKASFERFFQINGDDNSWRHNYVMCAWLCRQWAAFDEEAAKLTDINYSYFGGQEAFEETKKYAHEQVVGKR